MAIVGTAYVRLRVIGDKLKNDIAKSTSSAIEKSAPDLAKSGEKVGEKISDGVGDSLEKSVSGHMGKIADDIGDAIGRRMAENMGKSLRKRAGAALSDGMSGLKTRTTAIGDRLKGEWEKTGGKWANSTGKGFMGKLKGIMVSAIGAAITALPSAIAFTGALVGAVAATLVTALSTIGPAAAGAALTAVAAFSTIKITAGLVGLALKQQTPALKDFQKRLDGFKTSIASPIQAGLLSGFNAAIRISQPIIAGLTPMLKELGNNVGDIAIGFADAFRQGAMLERLQQILTVNNDAVKLGGVGVTAFAQAFVVLLSHLGPIIEYLASGVQQLGQWALTSILAAEASGRLDSFVTKMFDSLTYFVGILVDFGIGIWNVFKAAHGASGGMLVTLQGVAARFKEWTGSTEGQARMTTFFENMRVITGRVLQILGQLSTASGRALEGTNVESVLNGLNSLVTIGRSVGKMFEQIRAAAGDKLGEAFAAFANMLINLANSGVLGTLAGAFANLFNIISLLVNIPGLGSLLAFGAGLAVLYKTVSLLWTVLGPIVRILFFLGRILFVVGEILVGAFGIVPVLIGAAVAALIWFFTQTQIGRDIIAAVWNFIKTAISAAVDWIVGAWDHMVAAFRIAAAWVANLATSIWQAVSTAFNNVLSVVMSVFGTVRDFIVGVWNAIWGFISPILQGIWNVISTVFGAIVSVIEGYLNILWQIWIRVWPLLALPIRVLYGVILLIWNAIYAGVSFVVNALVTFVVWAWNGLVAGVSAALNAVWTFIQFIWNAIWGFIQPIIAAIVGFIVERWNNLVHNVQAALTWVWGIIVAVWNAVLGFLRPIMAAIGGAISGAWNAVVGAVQGALNRVSSVIRNVWNGVTSFLSGVMDKIKGLVSGAWDMLSGAGTAALNGIKAAVNTVIGILNNVIGGINAAINLANKLPGADIPQIPKIPKLARGGVVSPRGGGTLAMIAEAGRPERVEPLDPQGLSRRDRAIITELAGSAASGANVQVYIGTRELTELVEVVVEEREDSLAGRVLTGTKG